jgi:hypothetical protein
VSQSRSQGLALVAACGLIGAVYACTTDSPNEGGSEDAGTLPDGGGSFVDASSTTDAAHDADADAGAKKLTLTATFAGAPMRANFWADLVIGMDVNGDGVKDILYGEPDMPTEPDGGAKQQGRVTVLSGSDLTPIETIRSTDVERRGTYGYAVASIGDVNGDTKQDIAIGSPVGAPGTALLSKGYVDLLLSNAGPTTHLPVEGTVTRGYLGRSLVYIGGASKLLAVAEPTFKAGRVHGVNALTGAEVYVTDSLPLGDDTINERRAYTIFAIPDCDGDGVADFAANAQGQNDATDPPDSGIPNASTMKGRAYFYSGATGTLLAVVEGPAAAARLGSHVAEIGDINGDGVNEYLIGAAYGKGFKGVSYVVDGKVTRDATSRTTVRSLGAEPKLVLRSHEGTTAFATLGYAGAHLWDLDGDGTDDYAVGAPAFTTGKADAGPDAAATDVYGGAVEIYSGKTGALITRITGKPTGGQRIGGLLAVDPARKALLVASQQGDDGLVQLYLWK